MPEMSLETAVPGYVRRVLAVLERHGFEAWLVGGCVRDLLLGRAPADYDIASSAPPERVTEIFPHTAATGIRYGTVTVLDGGRKTEVTAFRAESDYLDGRRPSSVRFTGGIREDLARRDFTVNAMAYHPARGLLDPFDGRSDLRAGLIRAVGAPQERFREDALRILRAFRFCARYGFAVEPRTLRAAQSCAGLVAALSGERIRGELSRTLRCGPAEAARVVSIGALGFLGFRPLSGPALADLRAAGRAADGLPALWAAFFFCGIPSPAARAAAVGRLKFDRALRQETGALLGELSRRPPEGPAAVKRRLYAFGRGPALFAEYLRLCGPLLHADASQALAALQSILDRREPYALPMLAVTGGDLLDAGYLPGPAVGRALETLLFHVMEHPEDNVRARLLSLLGALAPPPAR
jgi:tRNA nucleotidyltransferase (CCA-adding enzyme)